MTKAKTKEREHAPALFPEAQAQEPAAPKPIAKIAEPKPKAPKSGTNAVAKVERRQPLADEASDEIATLLRVVSDPGCDVAKAERIEGMIERARAKRAQIYYDKAYNALQEELPEITKDNKIVIEKNGKVIQSTPFANYLSIQRIAQPILRRHGFTLEHRTEPGKDGVGIVVVSTLSYSHGIDYRHAKIAILPLKIENSGSKNDIQGVNSSISYGKRINTNTLLDLRSNAPQEVDRDGHHAKKLNAKPENQEEPEQHLTPKEVEKLNTAIKECGVGAKTFCTKYGIGEVEDLPPNLLAEALKACSARKALVEAKAPPNG